MRYYEDRSGVEDEAQYQCQDEDCRQVSLGKQLLPIVHEVLKDDPSHPYGVSGTGEFRCNVRRCPYCRGDMKKIVPQ